MPKPPPEPVDFVLSEPAIELAQLLKAVGACDSGGEAKHLVQSGGVLVNGAPELRRGKKLVPGDVVFCRGRSWRCVEGKAARGGKGAT